MIAAKILQITIAMRKNVTTYEYIIFIQTDWRNNIDETEKTAAYFFNNGIAA